MKHKIRLKLSQMELELELSVTIKQNNKNLYLLSILLKHPGVVFAQNIIPYLQIN